MITTRITLISTVLLSAGLTACGGGGSPTNGFPPVVNNNSSGNSYQFGIFMPSSTFKGRCAAPRRGNTADRAGTTLDENLWLRSWTNELYLWFSEVPDTDPGSLTTAAYFPKLKTPAITASGADKDKFHFTWDTADYDAFVQSGASAGYGIEYTAIVNSPPRRAVVAFTEPGSPGANANVNRGAELVTVDGVDFVNGSNATALNAGLSPARAGETHTFVFREFGATTNHAVTLTSAIVTSTPVQNVKTVPTVSGSVGYLLFNDHIATSESQLITAITTLRSASVVDLYLDIRYNGGGYLYIASELAYMIAGAAQTAGKTFERTLFNSRYTTVDPVTGQPLTPVPFLNRSQSNVALPTLNLSKVYVLTGPGTCSASESIMNGLRGAGIQVIQIGSTTCGKPYGFYPQDNCGTTYFSIQFKGVNEVGFGDYTDGFSPQNTTTARGEPLPGCSVADDFSRALGDPLEGRFAAGLGFRATATCPTPSGLSSGRVSVQSVVEDGRVEAVAVKSPLREMRLLQ